MKGVYMMQIPIWLHPLLLVDMDLPLGMLFCYLPMGNQLKYPARKIAGLCFAAWVLFVLMSVIAYQCGLRETNVILIPALVVFFPLYRLTLRTDRARALAVFVCCCTLLSYPTHFSYMLDAWLHPNSGIYIFSLERALAYNLFSVLIIAACALPVRHYLTWLVDHFEVSRIWNTVTVVALLFLAINMLVVPISYQTLHTGRMFFLYAAFEIWSLLVQVFFHRVFYLVSVDTVNRAEQEKETRLWEIQASQYQALRSRMRETARLRHDFRHSVRILTTLARKGDWESLQSYLGKYEENDLSEPAGQNWCANAALNALFSYYYELAGTEGIRLDWHLELPDPLTVSELDLASLFGNLLENAVSGCRTVPAAQRCFSLSAEMKNGKQLYIVSTNRFNGFVKKRGDEYLSTRQGGRGIGLPSIAAVAEKYHGSARFSHSGTEFWVDIVLKLP